MPYKVSLKAARVNAELTLTEASDRIGCSVSTLKNWEMKKTYPTMPTMERICEVYGVPLEMLKIF